MRTVLRTEMTWLFAAILALGLAQAMPAAAATRSMEESVRQTLASLYETQPDAKNFANRAKGMLVFPDYSRGGLIVGGGYARGALVVNGKIVEHYKIMSGSIGLQAGYQERDQVIMFMSDEALNNFRQGDGWQLGVDASFALIDAGQGGSITTQDFTDPVVVFVNNNRGLMGSLAFGGDRIVKIEE